MGGKVYPLNPEKLNVVGYGLHLYSRFGLRVLALDGASFWNLGSQFSPTASRTLLLEAIDQTVYSGRQMEHNTIVIL
jgi:hypothetical protein